jgi:(2R)-sulfolactate sulfo-lyase subunit alpha
MTKLIKLHPLDNVLIVVEEIAAAERLLINDSMVYVPDAIAIGHKVAEVFIEAGEKIIKYGASIGSATTKIATGMHVHLHNMKSDYIPTYTIEKAFRETND